MEITQHEHLGCCMVYYNVINRLKVLIENYASPIIIGLARDTVNALGLRIERDLDPHLIWIRNEEVWLKEGHGEH